MFRFAQPEFLYLLIFVPILLFLFGRAGKRVALRFPSTRILGQISALVRSKPGRFSKSLRWLALIGLILALARPQWGNETTEITHSGVDIMIAVDLSTSMWAHDFEIAGVYQDRLTVVKRVLDDFISARKRDRLGLIAFSGQPYLVSPLTLNHQWIDRRVRDLQIGLSPDGTAIGSAIASATKRLKDLSAETRILILMTDGSNNMGQIEPIQAAEAAKTFGVKIYTIGVGRPGMVNFPQILRDGTLRRDRNGNIMFQRYQSEIDLETLEKIANITEGKYFHATSLNELQNVYAEIDQLEKTEATLNVQVNYKEQYAYPLIAGLILLLLDILLHQTWLRRLP